MKIRIEGKAHLKGTSKKNGQPYDFIRIHYLGPDRGVTGKAALTLALESQNYNYDAIPVGVDAVVEFDNRGKYYLSSRTLRKKPEIVPLEWGLDYDSFVDESKLATGQQYESTVFRDVKLVDEEFDRSDFDVESKSRKRDDLPYGYIQ